MRRTPSPAPPIGRGSRGTRFESNPDDVFHVEVRRPANGNHVIIDGDHGEQQQPRSFSAAEESYRRLHCAVIDGKLDTLRRLLIQSNIDVNSRSSTGNTAGHEVGNRCILVVGCGVLFFFAFSSWFPLCHGIELLGLLLLCLI